MSGSQKTILIVMAAFAALVLFPPLALVLAFLLLVRTLEDGRPQPVTEPVAWGACKVEPAELTAGGEPLPVTVTYTGSGRLADEDAMGKRLGPVAAQGPLAQQLRRGARALL